MSAKFNPLVDELNGLNGKMLLVSASAGTGKTWLVTHLACRWLMADERNDPATLLMVTFSRPAARDLKARLRQAVVEFGEELKTMVELDDDEHARLLTRQRQVLARLDDVNARTIHSFAQMVTNPTAAEPTSGSEIYDRAVNEEITRLALQDPAAFSSFLESIDDNTDKAVGKLRARLSSASQNAANMGGLDRTVDGQSSKAFSLLPEQEASSYERAVRMGEAIAAVGARAARIMALDASLTYDEMIAGAYWDAVTGRERATTALRDAFKLVLIDEFQDTDAAQWAVFEEAFAGHVPMVLVGDPKQAIYGFRGGDVRIFQSLLGRARGGDPGILTWDLEVNYRSKAKLLGCLNALFTAGEHPAAEDDEDADEVRPGRPWALSSSVVSAQGEAAAIEYAPVKVAPSNLEGGSFEVRELTAEHPLRGRAPSREPDELGDATAQREEIALDVVSVVKGKLIAGYRPEQVAVLVATNYYARDIAKALARAGVPASLSKTESVFASAAAKQVRCLLWALSEAANPRRSGLLAYTWFSSLGPDETPALARALEEHGASSLARRALGSSSMVTVLESDEPERNWTDVNHLFDLLAEQFPKRATPAAALSWLEEEMSVSGRSDDGDTEASRRIESDGGAVSVMTLHKAKGLQFDVVLVPFIEDSLSGQTRSRNPYRDQRGTLSTDRGLVFDLARLSGPKVADDSQSSVDEEMLVTDEAARLIYVALTRAVQELVVWIADADRHQGRGPVDRVAQTSLWRVLIENYLRADAGKHRELAESIGEDYPYEAGITFTPVPEGLAHARVPKTVASDWISTEGLRVPPKRLELLRRWSYSALHVHGTASDATEILDAEVPDLAAAFDGDALAEDDADADAPRQRLGAKALGGYRGNVVGVAAHQVFEEVVGDQFGAERERLEAVVASSFDDAGLKVANLEALTADFQAMLDYPLGPLLDGLSLNEMAGNREVALAREMRFTLPLEGSGGPVDQLRRIAGLAASFEGPYQEFFGGLQNGESKVGRLFQGFLVGSVDLVVGLGKGEERRFVVLDYKSNLLKSAKTYGAAELVQEMASAGYPLQALLYSVALHRYLAQRLASYDPERHLSGALYYYIRAATLAQRAEGDGLAAWEIPAELVVGTSEILAGRDPRA